MENAYGENGMNSMQKAYSTAKDLYAMSLRAGIPSDKAFNRIVARLTRLYPLISPLRIKEIATLAML